MSTGLDIGLSHHNLWDYYGYKLTDRDHVGYQTFPLAKKQTSNGTFIEIDLHTRAHAHAAQRQHNTTQHTHPATDTHTHTHTHTHARTHRGTGTHHKH